MTLWPGIGARTRNKIGSKKKPASRGHRPRFNQGHGNTTLEIDAASSSRSHNGQEKKGNIMREKQATMAALSAVDTRLCWKKSDLLTAPSRKGNNRATGAYRRTLNDRAIGRKLSSHGQIPLHTFRTLAPFSFPTGAPNCSALVTNRPRTCTIHR